jgi:NDP-sugar pyrophosphorylase family protein
MAGLRSALAHWSPRPTRMRGIILAGGTGSRLWPMTLTVSKQLVPIFDKPTIYYPLSTLMLAGIREILVITTPREHRRFEELLGNGDELGIELHYAVQPRPEGVAQSLVVGANFAGHRPVGLIWGDNLFYGTGLYRRLPAYTNVEGARAFAYPVDNPQAFGVVEFDGAGRVRHRVVRHRPGDVDGGRHAVRAENANAARDQCRLHRGDRLARGIHRRQATGQARPAVLPQRLRRLSQRPARRAG